jgi:hypothetical protein
MRRCLADAVAARRRLLDTLLAEEEVFLSRSHVK